MILEKKFQGGIYIKIYIRKFGEEPIPVERFGRLSGDLLIPFHFYKGKFRNSNAQLPNFLERRCLCSLSPPKKSS